MAIYYLNGIRLKNALLAGADALVSQQEAINQINVFPVPDGDTGTNMALTVQAIANAIRNLRRPKLSELTETVAHTALMNARGNSGAIVAQFFQGLAQGFEGKIRVTAEHFAEIVSTSASNTRNALVDPKEGTIITVMDDWARYIKETFSRSNDFKTFIPKSLDAAKTSLRETPEKLEVLADAGVVDAGAQGFTYFLEGVVEYIEEGVLHIDDEHSHHLPTFEDQQHAIENLVEPDYQTLDFEHSPHELHDGEINYQFCTESIVQGHNLDPQSIKEELQSWGDCLIALGNHREVKIHIHTNAPDLLFDKLKTHGQLLQTKAEDMWAQYRKCVGITRKPDIALITDSSASLPQEFIVEHNIRLVPLHVMFGRETFLDTVNITNDQFYEKLASSKTAATTSQPTPADFMRIYEQAEKYAKSAVAIFMSGELSGTLQAAQFAAEHSQDFPIHVIDSRAIAGALGLIVQIAAEAISQGLAMREVKRRVSLAIKRASIMVSPSTLHYMIKGGRINKQVGKVANMLNLLPIIGVDSSGKTKRMAMTHGVKKNREKMLELAIKNLEGKQHKRIMVVHAQAEEDAKKIAQQLQEKLGIRNIPVTKVPPTLGAHAGPGAVGIATLGFNKEDRIF